MNRKFLALLLIPLTALMAGWYWPIPQGAKKGELVYVDANDPAKLTSLTNVATGRVLASGGATAAPSWATAPTLTGATFSGLTASKPVFTDANKALVSTGTLGADQGGTGLATYTIGDVPYASGATTISKLAIGANGTIARSNGTAPTWTSAVYPATAVRGDVIVASAANQYGQLTIGAASTLMVSNGTDPSWSAQPAIRRPVTVGVADTYALAASDCGRVYVATKTSATQVYTLPAATLAGCQFTFIAGHADGEILINSAVDGDGCVVTAFSAVGADADTAIVSKADCTPGIKNTAGTNAVGDSITLVADGTATWYGVGIASGIWATQ